jgi:hypothetical protein
MAAEPRSTSGDFSRQFLPVLRHALSECLLIIMLFVTALVSYSATSLARICRLRSPCILCSRLDLLLHGKAWFSEELVCPAHRLEIARLSYCQSHQKLAHPDDICDRCHRSCIPSVGRTGNLKNVTVNYWSGSRHAHHCSCCSVQLKKTRNVHRLRHNSESEICISDDDDDDRNAIPHEARERAKGISSVDVQMPPLVSGGIGLSMLPADNTIQINSMEPMNTANRQSSDNKAGNFAESSDRSIGHGLDRTNWSQINANDNKNDMQWKAMPEQLCTELPKEKSMYLTETVVILI